MSSYSISLQFLQGQIVYNNFLHIYNYNQLFELKPFIKHLYEILSTDLLGGERITELLHPC